MRYFEKSAAAVLWAPYSLSRDINMNLSKKKPLIEKKAVVWKPETIEKAVASRISRAANLDPGQKRDLLRKAKNQLKNLWSEAVNDADSAFVRARYTTSAASRFRKAWNESDAAEASLASIVKARKNVQSLLDN